MYYFMIIGDLFRLYAIIALFVCIIRRKSCAGISGRSQLLFAVSYYITYFDDLSRLYLFPSNIHQILLVSLTSLTTVFIYFVYSKTYQGAKDTFTTEMLLLPSFLIALWVNKEFTPLDVAYAFGVYIESVAILPQFYMILNGRKLEKAILPYLVAMGLYKTMYLIDLLFIYQESDQFVTIEGGAGILYILIFVLFVIECFIAGVKITESGKQNFFRNLFLITTNETLTDRLNIVNNIHVDSVTDQSHVEKV